MGAKLSGSSGKKYGIDQNADINVTPFVDVMLVLLIIFMVAAPLATQSLKLDLPPPMPDKNPHPKPMVLLDMTDDGSFYLSIKDKTAPAKSSLDGLAGDLSRTFAQAGLTAPDDQKVTIHSSKHVTYGHFMEVLNQLEKTGYDKVSLAIDATS